MTHRVQRIDQPMSDPTTLPTPHERGVPLDSPIVMQYATGVGERAPLTRLVDATHYGTYHEPWRWCVPGEPWVERPVVPAHRPWENRDLPGGALIVWYDGPTRYGMYLPTAGRTVIVAELNTYQVRQIVAITPGDTP